MGCVGCVSFSANLGSRLLLRADVLKAQSRRFARVHCSASLKAMRLKLIRFTGSVKSSVVLRLNLGGQISVAELFKEEEGDRHLFLKPSSGMQAFTKNLPKSVKCILL